MLGHLVSAEHLAFVRLLCTSFGNFSNTVLYREQNRTRFGGVDQGERVFVLYMRIVFVFIEYNNNNNNNNGIATDTVPGRNCRWGTAAAPHDARIRPVEGRAPAGDLDLGA